MSVLVSGGAGYIGSHTVKALLEAGRQVVVLDDFSAGHRGACAALQTIAAPGQLVVVEASIADTATVEATCRQHGIDAALHFAAWLSVGDSVTDPAGYYRNNVTGSLGLLDGLCRAGVTRLIFSSTCATYGEPQRVPLDETHPQQPINAYGETKLAVERALPHFETAYGLRSVALRYFNAAGADPDGLLGEDHSPEIHIIPRAIFAARGTDALKVFGEDYPTPDGTCLRDYIHVTDLADAHLRPSCPSSTAVPRPASTWAPGRRTRSRRSSMPWRASPVGRSPTPLRRDGLGTPRACTPPTAPSVPPSAGPPGTPISMPSWGRRGAGSMPTPTATATEGR